ncbi:BTB/POZ domain protein [Rhizoctonia solani AG-3 Rhs1AP]|uniref:BTB/POZ domain protein n=2 Tax=Rhizoctonia solani AG-3 TaxID=1086053 RepID=A0A074SEL9_9AGAM|nr:BTB/POZ domain protein [Rhizoctonia solani AG-3 Rhs1AP]KEP48477.1 BTB/POZ domain protein [Rhizoctonia solani 123E]
MLFLNPPSNAANKMSPLNNQSGSAVFIGKASDADYDDNPREIASTKPSAPIMRHPEFFFDNTLIAIQIENTLFNVHKYQLTKSEVFSEMFKMPKLKGDEPEEGSSPEHPIVIHGAAASDFAALLKVLYASHFSSNQPAPEASLVIPAFRLANLLGFSELRTYLLPLAENNLDDVDKIVFAREFDIKEWLAPALTRLCKRDTVLSTEEARKLQVDSVLLIWRMREQHRTHASITPDSGVTYCQNCTGWKYHGCGTCKCNHCHVQVRDHYMTYSGPGNMGAETNTYDTALEAEVKQWVEGTCVPEDEIIGD